MISPESNEIIRLLNAHNLYSYPVDVLSLAQKEGFRLVCESNPGIDPSIRPKADYKVIYYPAACNKKEKRMRIARQIACFYKVGRILPEGTAISDERLGQQTEDFACELLMPFELLDGYIRRILKSRNYAAICCLPTLLSIAFDVPEAVARRRYTAYLRNLNVIE